MARALILTGGIFHPFETSTPALASVLAEAGIAAESTRDIEAGLAGFSSMRAEGAPPLLVVFCLRFRMELEKYAPHRAEWAFQLSAAGRDAITRHLSRGGGILAIHTGLISFDDWPGWAEILGARWVWGRSGHPPYGAVRARPTGVAHPITRGLAPFTVEDEVYSDMDLAPDIEPLLTAETADGASGPRPVLWARQHGGGRVVFSGLGHDAASLTEPSQARILRRAALFALGRPNPEIEAQ